MSLSIAGVLAAPALPELGGASTLFEGVLSSRIASSGADAIIQTAIQLGENGNISFKRYNLTSIGANFLMPGKVFTSAFLGWAGEYSIQDNWRNSLFGQRTLGTVTFQTIIFGSFGKASEAGSNLMIKFGTGKFEAELGSNILGNIVPGVGSVIEKMNNENNK